MVKHGNRSDGTDDQCMTAMKFIAKKNTYSH